MGPFCSCPQFLLIVLLALSACGDEPANVISTCIPGHTQACFCVGARRGVQVCSDDGRFEPCNCTDDTDVVDATASDAGGDVEDSGDLAGENDGEDAPLDSDVTADTPPDDDLDWDEEPDLPPPPAIRIELTWVTHGDTNPSDHGLGKGSDLDLHFLHPDGSWNQSPGDCYWDNQTPDWGDESNGDGDPALVIDDEDGWGPEVIVFEDPGGTDQDPATYAVGVYYFSDNSFGASTAEVRIIIDGEEQFNQQYQELMSREFWDVAQINWPSQDIDAVDQHYPAGFP